MSDFDIINDSEGKEYLVFDSSELYDDSQMGDKFDDFEVVSQLGAGNFGVVFKVRSKINNKVYAIKRLNLKAIKEKNNDGEKAVQLTRNEASFLNGLNHPHIIKFYKKFEEGDYLYYVTEYVSNGDIKGLIEAHKEFNKHISEDLLWTIFLQSMSGLTYIHNNNVIHRDIKPENLLIDNNMIVKIADFGTSAVMKNDKDEEECSQNEKYAFYEEERKKMEFHGTVVGTDKYMSIDVLEKKYDQKADVFSMGCSFFEMCYFHIPKEIKPDYKNKRYIYKKIEEPGDKNVHYSKELLDIINLMIEEEPSKRKTSKEIKEMLEKGYSKRYVKNSSIDSIMRCLYPLTQHFLNMEQKKIDNMPITRTYIQCLKNHSDLLSSLNNNKDQIHKEEGQSRQHSSLWINWSNSIQIIRRILSSKNYRLEIPREIEPRFVFAFLIKELHNELNTQINISNDHKYIIRSGEESKTNQIEVMLNYVDDFMAKFNSEISNSFSGLAKITDYCNECKIKTFSFNSFFFITFNLEHILKKNNIVEFNLHEQLFKQKYTLTEKLLYCNKCLNKTMHSSYKEFYYLPNFLVISLLRGITYECKTPVNLAQKLDLTNVIEFEYGKKQYYLVSLLGREENKDSFFSIVLAGNKWYYCKEEKIEEINFPCDFNSFGDILMLFYM